MEETRFRITSLPAPRGVGWMWSITRLPCFNLKVSQIVRRYGASTHASAIQQQEITPNEHLVHLDAIQATGSSADQHDCRIDQTSLSARQICY